MVSFRSPGQVGQTGYAIRRPARFCPFLTGGFFELIKKEVYNI